MGHKCVEYLIDYHRILIIICSMLVLCHSLLCRTSTYCLLKAILAFCSILSVISCNSWLIYLILLLIPDMPFVYRFWTVRYTVWTCIGYWAHRTKLVISKDWALFYQYEWSMLLEDLLCASSLKTQQASCWTSLNDTSTLSSLCHINFFCTYSS
jgi:hypothetical protein